MDLIYLAKCQIRISQVSGSHLGTLLGSSMVAEGGGRSRSRLVIKALVQIASSTSSSNRRMMTRGQWGMSTSIPMAVEFIIVDHP
jgi:hypothetical protein